MATEKKPEFDLSELMLDQGKNVLPAPKTAKPVEKPEVKQVRKKESKPAALVEAGEGGSVSHVGGRPTFKAPNTECVRVTLDLPLETKRILQQALAGQFFGVYRSQTEVIDAAIRYFIEKGGK